MDNECDIWDGTHDDIMPELITASAFVDRFIDLAKKARAKFPEIKICGPVSTSEWHWYNWKGTGVTLNGKYYSFMEYFIKRCADEEKSSGIRVLDVVDIHHYPYAPTNNDALQNHRVFYDKNYDYPGANGVKSSKGGWDDSQRKEYIFLRINEWLDLHYGPNHGIKPGLSEWSPGPSEPNLASVIYASHLGTFANNGVELFSPWTWFTGMWETLHLFSRTAKEFSVSSKSSLENLVSAYTTVNEGLDSMTIVIVNRDVNAAHSVSVTINGFPTPPGTYNTLQISGLPATETFKSHSDNGLKSGSVTVNSNSFTINVPSLSTTSVSLSQTPEPLITGMDKNNLENSISIYPNPASEQLLVRPTSGIAQRVGIDIHDVTGRRIHTGSSVYDGVSPISLDLSEIPNGCYLLHVNEQTGRTVRKFFITK